VPATTPTVITRSTIRNCNGYCVYIDKSSNVTFDNNIIHSGLRYIVFVLKVTNYAFINNVMIGLKMDPVVVAQSKGTGMSPNNAAYEQYIPVKLDTDNVTVTKNLVQGSQDNGFVFPFTSCDKISTYPFSGNTAGSCFAGFVINVMSGKQCIAASGFLGYANYIGLIANPPGVLT
jgi:nitrous oxidase accessory protein NosD